MVTKKKASKKKVAKKKPARIAKKKVSKKKRSYKSPPKSKYHLDGKIWNRLAVMKVICGQLIQTAYGVAYICRNNNELPTIGTIFQWLVDDADSLAVC